MRQVRPQRPDGRNSGWRTRCGRYLHGRFDEFFSHRGTKTRRIEIQISVDGPGDPIAHERLAEVEQIPEFEARETEIRQQLLLVRRGHPLDRLQLHNGESFDNQICPKAFVKRLAAILDSDANLPLDAKPPTLQRAKVTS
jgi:hypothetical protein